MASRAIYPGSGVKKTTASNPVITTSSPSRVDEVKISTRAYELWEERGRPVGSDQEDWFQAEQELNGRRERTE